MTKTSVPSDKNVVLSYSILQILKKTYRGLLIAPKPPRPRYPRPAPRNPPPRPRGGLLLVVMPGLFVRFGSTLICLPLQNNLSGFVKLVIEVKLNFTGYKSGA